MRCLVLLSMLFTVSVAYAENISNSGVTVFEGVNSITIAVANNSGSDLEGLTFRVDKSRLPEWLTSEENSSSLDAPDGESISGKFILSLKIENGSIGKEVDIPLIFTDKKGNSWEYSIKAVVSHKAPQEWALYENVPNPFNPSTSIRYSLKETSHARLIIYNSLGQNVRTLVDARQEAGSHEVVWDGKDDNGGNVSTGIYLCNFQAGGFSKTMKMLLVK